MNSIDFSKIKLVIWDLDNTFWKGIISESEIVPEESNITLIKDLTDAGIINSICSKNTFEVCENKLKELQIFDYFVFPSIDWSSKGHRVKELIQMMSLRPENVLFIDDDVTNLNESLFYSENLMVAEPNIIRNLIDYVNGLDKKDKVHKRLKQYQLLETKAAEQKKYNNNEEFLYASNIKVDINEDCLSELERIHDLLIRSNQLNYTKKRINIAELESILKNKSFRCGTVSVKDNFGDYGIVGFFALGNERLEHFLFSCRTIGLGIEQYVYSFLNFPLLAVSGEVVSNVELKPAPLWINTNDKSNKFIDETQNYDNQDIRILIKGPCDLSTSMTYIRNSEQFVSEFTYVSEERGNVIAAHNHSAHILGLKELSSEEQNTLYEECIFTDKLLFSGTMFSVQYDLIFLSTLIESNFGIYRKKGTNSKVAFSSYISPLTNPDNWNDYINEKLFTSDNVFSEEYLRTFTENYEFLGKTKPEEYVNFLRKTISYLNSKTILCLILGVEFPCEKNMEYDFKERHISHKELNDSIRKYAESEKRIKLIDLNDIVKSQQDFISDINHYTSRIYYEISLKISEIINEYFNVKIKSRSRFYIYIDTVFNYLKTLVKSAFNSDSKVFIFLYYIFKKTGRTRK